MQRNTGFLEQFENSHCCRLLHYIELSDNFAPRYAVVCAHSDQFISRDNNEKKKAKKREKKATNKQKLNVSFRSMPMSSVTTFSTQIHYMYIVYMKWIIQSAVAVYYHMDCFIYKSHHRATSLFGPDRVPPRLLYYYFFSVLCVCVFSFISNGSEPLVNDWFWSNFTDVCCCVCDKERISFFLLLNVST